MLASITAAIRFLTRIPMPGVRTELTTISGAVAWFPPVGAIIGFVTAYVYILASNYLPPQVSALLAMVFNLMLTGGLHEDGATDAADGLCGGWTNSQVIEIMRDSRIGAYGAIFLWVLLMFRWVTLMTLNQVTILMTLPLAMAWGRWAIVTIMYLLPTISPGLASNIQSGMSKMSIFLTSITIGIITLAIYMMGFHNVWKPAVAAISATIAWTAYLKKRIGGQTGDLLGAGNQLVEAAVILTIMIT